MQQCFVERATLNQRRAQCTLMAATTNDLTLQADLPQVLLPNITGHKQKWRDSPSLAAAPKHIQVFKDTNGWSTADSMKTYFKALRAYLKKKGKKQVVIMMDCHPSHYAFSTLNYCTKLKWKVLLVPSRLTWLLQPLDAYHFASFKHRLTESMAARRTHSTSGTLEFEDWLSTSLECLNSFFQEAAGDISFRKCGCTAFSAGISAKVKEHVVYEKPSTVRRLTEPELHEYMGKKVKHIHKLLFKETIPDSAANGLVHIHPLARRISRKRSLESL